MKSDFEKNYNSLNPRQKEAVDLIDGPLMVVAGPGTGKTHLLSMRVANILKRTDTSENNILCLTFTNNAATNMRERLVDLIGPSAHNVNVKTFHSFAAEIMNSFPDYFWNGAHLSIAPDGVQIEIIVEILETLEIDNPLASTFAGNFTAINDIKSALGLVKEAGLTPDKLLAIINANIAYLNIVEPEIIDILAQKLSFKNLETLQSKINDITPQPIDELIKPLISLETLIKESLKKAVDLDMEIQKTTNTSYWKRRLLQSINGKYSMENERKRNLWWQSIAMFYKKYRQAIHSRGYYDYSDMLVEVLAQIEKNPDLLSNIQERYLYVLIDEFQDSNAAQFRLATLVSEHHSAIGKPNLMIVGDDDQTIFKFNGAELNNLVSFQRLFKDTKIVVLNENYRSSQEILDLAGKIAVQSNDRLVKRIPALTKDLISKTKPEKNTHIEHQIYLTREQQLSDLSNQIAQQYLSGDHSIAILARNHDSLRQMASYLLKLDIPLSYDQQSNILEHEIIKTIINMAELIEAIKTGDKNSVSNYLSKLLAHPMWQIEPLILYQLAMENRNNKDWLISLSNHKDKKLKSISSWLLWLSSIDDITPLPIMIEYLIGLKEGKFYTSQIKNYYTQNKTVSNSYLQAISAIQMFRELVNDFSKRRPLKLEDFVRFIKLEIANNQIIADESPFVSDDNAISLLTVHKAKGLEFGSVYIIDVTEDNWQPRIGGRKPPANLPLQPYGEDFDDYVRLMYVASTRAKTNLVFSSFSKDHASQNILPSPIISKLIVPKNMPEPNQEQKIDIISQNITWPELESSNLKKLLSPFLSNYQLNVTALINFLDISINKEGKRGGPAYFKERNLLRLPEAKNSTLSYGTAMHSAMEYAQYLLNNHKFDLVKIINHYSQALLDEQIERLELNRLIHKGETALLKLFNENKYILPEGGLAEQRIADVVIGKAKIAGKLDRILITDTEILVTDYKTGKSLNDLINPSKSNAIKAWKHRFQLIFYALLISNSAKFDKQLNIDTQMVYLEAENINNIELNYQPTEQDLKSMTAVIEKVYDHIINLDLPNIDKYNTDITGIEDFIKDLTLNKI